MSKYDEVNKKWVVPLFTVGQRRVDFPGQNMGFKGVRTPTSRMVPEFKVGANSPQMQMQTSIAASNEIKFLSAGERNRQNQMMNLKIVLETL